VETQPQETTKWTTDARSRNSKTNIGKACDSSFMDGREDLVCDACLQIEDGAFISTAAIDILIQALLLTNSIQLVG